VSNGKGGDPRVTDALGNDVEHVVETDKFDNFGVRWLVNGEQHSSDSVRDGYISQFEHLWVGFVLAHETD
jgi:hypothetical protein